MPSNTRTDNFSNLRETSKLKGFFINVRSMSRRRTFMQHQLEHLGLNDIIQVWPAVDAADDNSIANSSYAPGHWRSVKWELTRVEIACFESHREIWRHVADNNDKLALVLEDDVILSSRFRSAISNLANSEIELDVTKFDGVHKRQRFGAAITVETLKPDGFEVRPIVQGIWSAAGYLVSNEGAHKLLEWSESYCDSVDDFLFRPRPGYRLFQLFPAVCAQGGVIFNHTKLTGENELFWHGEMQSARMRVKRNKGPIIYSAFRESKRGVRRLGRVLFLDNLLLQQDGHIGRVPFATDLKRLSHPRDLRLRQ